jgi:hypothetical protein
VYRRLEASRIVETLRLLEQRVRERFPEANLGRVVSELRELAAAAADRAAALGRPYRPVRLAVGLVIAALLGLVGLTLATLRLPTGVTGLVDVLQAVESGVNDVVFLAVAVWFLTTLEGRIKRRHALRDLHELRSIAHIVDMHQLTKDPEQVLSAPQPTTSSPQRSMSRFELGRYLDYCSELLSLTSKVAALYAQHLDDPVVLEAVNDLEALTTGLSGKIWQKISILDAAEGRTVAG